MRRFPAQGFRALLCALLTFTGAAWLAAAEDKLDGQETEWGSIHKDSLRQGTYELKVRAWPEDGVLKLPSSFPHIIQCWMGNRGAVQTVDFAFNQDATEKSLRLSKSKSADKSQPRSIYVLASKDSRQMSDGRIVFSALDSQVQGETAKLESHPGNHRIGFWTHAEDWVDWKFRATRWGMYNVRLTYSTASPDGTRIEVRIGKTGGSKKSDNEAPVAIEGKLKSTGSWYRYTTIDLGKAYLPAAGDHTLSVKCIEKVGGAVMNLKAVVLTPACEGTPPVQADDGLVTLHARDATVRGITLRWEPIEKKQTLGYWVKPDDTAVWSFRVNQPGEFEVEVLQGCGKGQGGSKMVIAVSDQRVNWQVEETGHFQNFKPRVVGRLSISEAGQQELSVKPVKIAKNAACDIRQIRLIPILDKNEAPK